LQVVVTTRPTAFSNSPGFSVADYAYCELVALPRSSIDAYTERWLGARRLTPRESADVRRLLKTRLELPHIRELARNPMQLANCSSARTRNDVAGRLRIRSTPESS